MRRRNMVLLAGLFAGVVGLAGCAVQDDALPGGDSGAQGDAPAEGAAEGAAALGPVDGRDLPPFDLDRVQAGDAAPDFTLASLAGPPVTLSSFQGSKNVVLVFYRGHW